MEEQNSQLIVKEGSLNDKTSQRKDYVHYVNHLIGEGCASHHCSIEAMSGFIDVAYQTIYRWQRGDSTPSGAGLIKLLRFAGYKVPGFLD